MKDRFKNPILHYGFLAAIYGVGAATLVFHTVGHAYGKKPAQTTDCSTPGVIRRVSINRSSLEPAEIKGNLCDQVVFTNIDTKPHLLALGEHQNHASYPGFDEKILMTGKSLTVTLGATGTYPLHDHLNTELQGEIIIAK